MANGLDRLERLFAYKRKASPTPSGRASPVAPIEQQFPSPSFIRPKALRMTAREEVRLRQVTDRSPSVPDVRSTQRHYHGHTFKADSADSGCHVKHTLVKSPSFHGRPTEAMTRGFNEFRFPKPPSRSGGSSPVSSSFDHSLHKPLPVSRGFTPLNISIPPAGLDTPPSSEPEDSPSSSCSPTHKDPPANIARLPTPGASPELHPLPDRPLRLSKSADAINKSYFKEIEHLLDEPFDELSLSRTHSQTSLSSAQHSFCSSTLREPDVNEFLNLSDDDIAESAPGSPEMSPQEPEPHRLPHMDLSISSFQPNANTLLTLTPPRASRPATAAAFEAARIARRYDFDLVYVVNLWPDNTTTPSIGNAGLYSSNKPMIGRLLAAHGLHHVPSPLQISEKVHMTILRADGWIEYQNSGAEANDLARGYACAFYTGQYARSASSRSSSPVSGVRLSERIDRGIVFAAYRKPKEGEDKLGRAFTEEDLGDLHRDAEVLVEMLIDCHAASRMRQPSPQVSVSEETGPIPTQQNVVA